MPQKFDSIMLLPAENSLLVPINLSCHSCFNLLFVCERIVSPLVFYLQNSAHVDVNRKVIIKF